VPVPVSGGLFPLTVTLLVTAKIPPTAKASTRKFFAKNDFTFLIILNFYRFQKTLAILFFILEPRQGYNRLALRYNTNTFLTFASPPFF
jgi:hypothetical protein